MIRGVLLFFGFGLLYALFWIFVEHFLWLSTIGRTVVFWALVSFEVFLFYHFIAIPLSKYFKISSGLSNEEAAALIGEFFPEIKDKLLNTVQLNHLEQTELLLASIEQKAMQFKSFSFVKAVNLKDNLRYLRYAIAPLLVIAPFYLFGKQSNIEDSLNRVVNYGKAFSPPAPFVFVVSNDSLNTIENTTFTLTVTTEGSALPEEVQIVLNDQLFYLNRLSDNVFEYDFIQPKKDQNFQLKSGNIVSEVFTLNVVKAPKIVSQNLLLSFPPYTGLKPKQVSSFSNIVVPEGTKITWTINTTSTDAVALVHNNSKVFLNKKGNQFSMSKRLFSNFSYSLNTSNSTLIDYEVLESKIEVSPDQSPKLNVQAKKGNTVQTPLYFYGQMTDDYGVSKLLFHYTPTDNKDDKKTIQITSFDKDRLDFYYTFPNSLALSPDKSYQLYFEVFDNDPYPGPNRTRSSLFYYNSKSQNRIKKELLSSQEDAFKNLEKELSENDQQPSEFDPVRMLQQKDKLSFNDRQNIRAILERQNQQNTVMERFTKKVSQALTETPDPETYNDQKDKLKERLENQRKQLEESQKELDELRELMNKLNKEELLDRVEQITKKNQTNQRSLEQMLELTKRYYVTQKSAQLQQELSSLAQKQQELSELKENKNTKSKQKEINQSFDALSKALENLRQLNNELTKPTPIPETQKEERSIVENQENALKKLDQKTDQTDPDTASKLNQQAQKEQKKAAKKIMQISSQMLQQMSSGGQQQLQEDIAMLRQILDNLLWFSFEQEALMERFKSRSAKSNLFAKNLISQNNLKTHFEHIDDSLFVLSVRQPLISEKINTETENIFSNIDKALRLFSDNANYRAVSAQQYVITSTNSLSDLLSNALNSMEMQFQISPGQGQGDMQLPDIIMSQEALKQQAESLSNAQDKGTEKESEDDSKESSNTSNKGAKSSEGGSSKEQGPSGKNSEGDGFSDSEESSQSLFELYQKQQTLRKALSDFLEKNGQQSLGNSTLDSMEKLEQLLLNQGVTNKTLDQMKALKYQYLKLDKALKKQGLEQQRTSRANDQEFNEATKTFPPQIKRFFNTKDILNRQSLPLRKQLNQRVINYFKFEYD